MRGDDAYAILKKKIEKNQTQPGATPEQAAQIQQNKEDIITLKGEADKKITKIYASSQGETHLEDSDNGPIQNMMLYGKSEQKQYSGKNLLNATLQTTTVNGVTCTNNGDGTYTVNGTASGNALFLVGAINIESEGEYKKVGCPLNGSTETYWLGGGSLYNDIGNGTKGILQAGTQLEIVIAIKSGYTCNNLLFKPMIVDASLYPDATYDDFEPYTGGQPSPSPDYPQEILSVKNPTVKVCGKNLLEFPISDKITQAGITFEILNDSVIKLTGMNDGSRVSQYVAYKQQEVKYAKLIPYKDVAITISTHNDDVIAGLAYWLKSENYAIVHYKQNKRKCTIDLGEDAKIVPWFFIPQNETYANDTVKFGVYYGTDELDYDVPKSQTVTLPYDLYGVKVASGGNVTIDGQQYVSDYFDVERGKLVRMVEQRVLKNAVARELFGDNYLFYWNLSELADGKYASGNYLYGYCDHYIADGIFEDKHLRFDISRIYIRDDSITNLSEFNNKYSENGLKVAYILNTPEEIDLTPEEIAALKALATYYPVTNISINSEQLDGYTVFNYPLPFEDEWNNVKQQVNDIKKDYLTKEDAEKEYQPKGDYLTKTAADDKYQTKAEAAEEKAAVIDMIYKDKVAAATTKAEVDTLFAEWWKSQYDSDTYSKSDMLERWFGNVLVDNRVHGVKTPLYAKSTSMIGELTDDSAGLVCTPSTEAVAGNDPFDHLPQFWCLEVSAEKQADGSHVVYYVEHIDSIDDVRSGEHLCWVLQKNTWKREWKDSEYKYLKMQCKEAEGYKRWPEGKDRTGKIHEYMAHPKYPGGMKDGLITCGTGLAPVNRTSHTNIVAKWRARGKQYSGGSGSLVKFLDIMMRLKYGKKGNSGTIEGCTNYNFQYTVAVSETGVERIILTKAQAANLLVGSAIMLGIQSGTDRNTASNYSIFDGKLITKIEDVTINDTVYSAVYVDNGGKTFNTTAGSTYMSTSPYYSGWNDNVKGRDGSRYNYQNGKEPGMLQGVEFMHGSYIIVSDELWQWGTDADGNYTFDCFKCYDQSKVSSEITNDYVKMDVPTLKFPQGTASWVWKYITDNAINDDVMWPETTDASGSGVGVGAGFSCAPASSGVRSAWVFGSLSNGGYAGVPCRHSGCGPSTAFWYGSSGAPGSEG